ncbi:hypothetical protein [Paenibacillus sp. 1P07SE]|uniref:hypothetical protein n=1 Tax=Paenibacillus sp. 1P07SE TaxID=3132209 RepID=UPI0039A58EFD
MRLSEKSQCGRASVWQLLSHDRRATSEMLRLEGEVSHRREEPELRRPVTLRAR